MFCTTSETEGEVCARKTRLSPKKFITDRSKAVVLLWFSVAGFGVRVSVTFRLTCVHIFFSSVSVAKFPPFGKQESGKEFLLLEERVRNVRQI